MKKFSVAAGMMVVSCLYGVSTGYAMEGYEEESAYGATGGAASAHLVPRDNPHVSVRVDTNEARLNFEGMTSWDPKKWEGSYEQKTLAENLNKNAFFKLRGCGNISDTSFLENVVRIFPSGIRGFSLKKSGITDKQADDSWLLALRNTHGQTLETLDLSGVSTPGQIGTLCNVPPSMYPNRFNLVHVNLSNTGITDAEAPQMAEFLKSQPKLETVDLSKNYFLTNTALDHLQPGLLACPQLSTVNLCNTEISDAKKQDLQHFFHTNGMNVEVL